MSRTKECIVRLVLLNDGSIHKAISECALCGAWAHCITGSTPYLTAVEWLGEHLRTKHFIIEDLPDD